MPLTPPEYANYGKRSGNQLHAQYAAKGIYEPTQYITPPPPMMFPQMHYTNMPSAPPPGLQHPQSFGPIAAPVLPPLNMPDRSHDHAAQAMRHERQQDQRRPQQAQSQPKEEKAVGGVSAVLDYEMDQMTDYVSEMAQKMYELYTSPHICIADIDIVRSVMPGSPVSPAFRKFVSGLLSSTRLPSSTILLGMNYLARRMNMLNNPGPYKSTDGQVWRMLTIALLLGSKFLDDNTFQNRSWSEVSGIAVSELNTLEHDWLEAIEWNLHVNLDTSEDFRCWLQSWANWRDSKNKQRNATLDRLAPLSAIDTNIQRPRVQQNSFSPASQSYNPYGASVAHEHAKPLYQTPARFDQPAWMAPGSANDLSPPSAPESGPNTPEYLNLSGASNWFPYDSSFYPRRHQAPQLPYVPQITPYHTPFHGQYSHNIWSHGPNCGCGYCARNEAYFMGNGMGGGYGQQAVVG
jgi:hypothetical protein